MAKNFRQRVGISVLLLALAAYLACSSDKPDAGVALDSDVAEDTKRELDVVAKDIINESDSLMSLDSDGTSTDTNSDTNDSEADAPRAPVEFDASLWQQSNPCSGEVTFPAEVEEFNLPNRPPPSQEGVVTRDEFIAEIGSTPEQALSIRPGTALLPGDGRSYDLYAEPGTDVPIHVYSLNDVSDFSAMRLSVTVMVDYEPVVATYVRWNSDRTEKRSQKAAKGIVYDIDSDFEVIDITIPSSTFSERRMYEVSVSFNVTTYDGAPWGHSQRYALFYGGYSRPARPCAESRLDIPWSDWEKKLYNYSTVDDLGPLFYDGITSALDVQSVIDVEPGETRRMYFSALSTAAQEGGKPTVLVPLFDGEPMGPVWWITQGNARGDYRTRVDARKSFEVTFPEEPGIYVVQVATWEDPYLYWRERDGTRNDDVSFGSSHDLHESSNPLHFRVVEPDEQ